MASVRSVSYTIRSPYDARGASARRLRWRQRQCRCRDTGHAAGGTTYDVASAGFSIAVPESWRTISADEFGDGGEWESVVTETPALAPYAQAFQGPDSVLKFVAVDPNVQDEFATNLNVIVEELPAGATLDDYEQAFVSQLESLPNLVGAIDRQRVELPAGPALRASYRLTLLTAGRPGPFPHANTPSWKTDARPSSPTPPCPIKPPPTKTPSPNRRSRFG